MVMDGFRSHLPGGNPSSGKGMIYWYTCWSTIKSCAKVEDISNFILNYPCRQDIQGKLKLTTTINGPSILSNPMNQLIQGWDYKDPLCSRWIKPGYFCVLEI